jgi:Fe-Mn family superoxide dismutase
MSHYILPDLRYDYAALEPHMLGLAVELHHDKHHRTYVEAANRAIERLLTARRHGYFEQVPVFERELAFNISGHILHSIFCQNLDPDGGGEPTGELAQAITRDFGSFQLFQRQMTHTALTIMGSGWAALVWDPVIHRLGTTQIHDHQSEITQGGIPLMVMDGWEHAYYLQYRADKKTYFESLWHLWNWEDVERRYMLARQVDLGILNVSDTLIEGVDGSVLLS